MVDEKSQSGLMVNGGVYEHAYPVINDLNKE